MTTKPLKAGILGCGKISSAYFEGIAPFSEYLKVTACADLFEDAAKTQAKEYGIEQVLSPDQLLENDDLDIIINLTPPQNHAEVNLKALNHGKHVYCEKPFGLNTAEAEPVMKLAQSKKLHFTCAPDTVLGQSHQTARELIEDGLIGRPHSATAFMACPGHENWHPNPAFYYQHGGGPVFDMAPYYLSALAQMVGPATAITARTTQAFEKRQIVSEPKKGEWMDVEIPTHLTGIIDYDCGLVATTMFSFDCMGKHKLPCIEIYGTEGSLTIPDPNFHHGEIFHRDLYAENETSVPLKHTYEVTRGIGPVDMAAAILAGRSSRACGVLAYHVLEIMESFEISSANRASVDIKSSFSKPELMPHNLENGFFV